jgi:uncharacterized protein YaeQ
VAFKATVYSFSIDLADSDREVYQTLELRVARHPSESEEYLLTRVFAFALEFTEGIEFSAGLADPDEPAICVRDLTGARRSWIDIGAPDATRLHKACKAVERVVVYTHKDPERLVGGLAEGRIHRVEALEVYAIDRGFLDALVSRLERRMAFSLSVTDRTLYLSIGGDTLVGTVSRHLVGGGHG